MAKPKIKKNTKLFRKYLFVITSVILMSVVFLCSAYLILAARHWNSEQLDTLQHNSDIIASNVEQMLARSGSEPSDKKNIFASRVVMICNTMRTMSAAIEADIFIADMDGQVVVCKEMLNEKLTFTDHHHCPVHGRYKINADIMEKASKGNYRERSNLGGTFIDTQLTSASPIVVNGKPVAVVFATEPVTTNWQSYSKQLLEVFFTAAILALLISILSIVGIPALGL